MNNVKQWLLIFCAVMLVNYGKAQPGSNDPTFNPTDVGFGAGDGPNNVVYSSVLQADNKIIIGGHFETYNGITVNNIARLNADGTLDNTFSAGLGTDNAVRTISIQSDGKIIIGGDFLEVNGVQRNHIARLNTNGTLDLTFNPGSGTDGFFGVLTSAIQTDGKILIGGDFTTFNNIPKLGIARLNINGTLDLLFNGFDPNIDWAEINRLRIQQDGKVLIGGSFSLYDSGTGNSIYNLARLNSNGTIDDNFDTSHSFSAVADFAVMNNGKIAVIDGFNYNMLTRLNANGTIDGTFNVASGTNASIWTIISTDDNKIIIGGDFTTYDNLNVPYVARINDNGTLDQSFSITFPLDIYSVNNITQQPNGGLIISSIPSGSFSQYADGSTKYIFRVNSNGTEDFTFNPTSGSNSQILASIKQPDGKIILVGSFTKFNNVNGNGIIRLNTNGSVDNTFNTGTGANHSIRCIALQADGKIIIGGDFDTFNGNSTPRLARLNSNGTLDNSFVVGAGFNSTVKSVVIDSQGKIIVGGEFTTFDNETFNRLLRLNSNGSVDMTFNIGSGFSPTVNAIALKNDGKIIVGGSFATFNGGSVPSSIVCLNSNGTLHSAFDLGNGFEEIHTLQVLNNQKILVGGLLFSFVNFTQTGLKRLNADGSADFSFNGALSQAKVYDLDVQTDGKIIVAGDFTTYGGSPRNGIARINIDGTLDNTFNPGSGIGNSLFPSVNTVLIQADGKIVIGGNFTSFDGIGRNRVARLLIDGDFICQTVEGTAEIASCSPITWIDGNTYSTSNNTATHLLVGAAQNGCDSLVTLNFTLWPCTQLQASDCNATNITMDQSLRAINVNAPAYRFRVVGANNGGAGWNGNTFIVDRPNRALKFSQVPGSYWGQTYSIEVAVGDGNGNFGPYGNACNVSLSNAIPTTQLQASDCGAINVNPGVNLFADAVNNATGYRFRVNGANVNNIVVTKIQQAGMRKLKMNEVSGIIQGETYTVEVAIRDAAGNWGNYGPECTVTMAGTPQLDIYNNVEMMQNRNVTAVDFGVNTSHNPFTTDFGIQVLNANDFEAIQVNIYDMSGKLIEINNVNPADIESARFGSNLASGMYMIEVKQGSNQAVIRQVKN